MAQSNGLSSNGTHQARPKEGVTSPYMSNDPNSNVGNFKIIESTLRGKLYFYIICHFSLICCLLEGEQFANAFFTTEKKIGKFVCIRSKNVFINYICIKKLQRLWTK